MTNQFLMTNDEFKKAVWFAEGPGDLMLVGLSAKGPGGAGCRPSTAGRDARRYKKMTNSRR
jgi:hypothetical protein